MLVQDIVPKILLQLLILYNAVTHRSTIIKSVSSVLISQSDQDTCCTAPTGKTLIYRNTEVLVFSEKVKRTTGPDHTLNLNAQK